MATPSHKTRGCGYTRLCDWGNLVLRPHPEGKGSSGLYVKVRNEISHPTEVIIVRSTMVLFPNHTQREVSLLGLYV